MPDETIQIITRGQDGTEATSTISEPTRLARLGLMLRTMQREGGFASRDDRGRERLWQTYDATMTEVDASLSGPLSEELHAFGLHLGKDASCEELRLASAQLLGWLDGLFQGLEAALGIAQDDAA